MMGWLPVDEFAALESGGTTAFRVYCGRGEWIERYGTSAIVSAENDGRIAQLASELDVHATACGWNVRRVFSRKLVRGPGANNAPELIRGVPDEDDAEIVLEHGLRFEVRPGGGYSAGLFCDQRENRVRLRALKPVRLLNLFAYTCAFSVAGAVAGARTTSVDISKQALGRGRGNFALNGLSLEGHRFVAEDVIPYLRRLVRRGETFDAVILDPPTFGHGAGRKPFRLEADLPEMLRTCRALMDPAATMLVSCNRSGWTSDDLRSIVLAEIGEAEITPASAQVDFPRGSGAPAVWVR